MPWRLRQKKEKRCGYTGKSIAELTVRIPGLNQAKRVRSVQHGPLKPTFQDGAMVIHLPIDVTDMLLIDR